MDNEDEIVQFIEKIHNRAHRSYAEKLRQVKFDIWFKNMKKRFREKAINCQICNENKYERRPSKQPMG